MNAFVRYTVMGIYKLFYNFKIEGWENVPEKEGVIIACNHRSYADPVVITMPMKKPVTYMAKEELFKNKIFGAFIRFLGAFPVKRGAGDMKVIDDCVEILESGRNVVIFPEGTRNKTDKFLLNFKTGAVAMAKKTGAYIVPFGLTGDYKFRSKNLTIRYGEPFKADNMSVEEANEKLFREVERLMLENLNENKENLMNA